MDDELVLVTSASNTSFTREEITAADLPALPLVKMCIRDRTYSEFMGKVNAKGIALNRKVLADLAMNNPKAFEKVVKTVK